MPDMIIRRDLIQGSMEWLMARAGKPTASDMDNLLTPKFKVRDGQMPATYLASKLAEAWQGGPHAGFGSWAMDQGSLLEDEAIPWLSLWLEKPIERVGLCETDDGRIACSPDGLIGETGVEIKCPEATAHVKYLLGGTVPDDYLVQVHSSMWVTGFKSWRFVSYRRNFPNLVVNVERDDEIQEAIGEALTLFLARFDRAMERMIEINGGPPPRPKEYVPKNPQPAYVSDPNDITP